MAATTTLAQPTTDPLDFLAIDALLSDEETRDPRHRPRLGARADPARDRRVVRAGNPAARARAGGRPARPLRHAPGRLRPAGRERRRLRARPASSSRPATPACAASSRSRARSAMFAIWRWGTEEQKERWLPPMHAGEQLGCFGLTEPDAGSDPGAMRTTRPARRQRLDPERHQDVDHERLDRRRRGRVGAHRRRQDQRLPRREGHSRASTRRR